MVELLLLVFAVLFVVELFVVELFVLDATELLLVAFVVLSVVLELVDELEVALDAKAGASPKDSSSSLLASEILTDSPL